jgi:hypothetical protein
MTRRTRLAPGTTIPFGLTVLAALSLLGLGAVAGVAGSVLAFAVTGVFARVDHPREIRNG